MQDYCNNEHGYHDIARLSRQIQQWLPWVDYLMLMWFEVRWQQTADPIFLAWAAPLRQRFNLSFKPCGTKPAASSTKGRYQSE